MNLQALIAASKIDTHEKSLLYLLCHAKCLHQPLYLSKFWVNRSLVVPPPLNELFFLIFPSTRTCASELRRLMVIHGPGGSHPDNPTLPKPPPTLRLLLMNYHQTSQFGSRGEN